MLGDVGQLSVRMIRWCLVDAYHVWPAGRLKTRLMDELTRARKIKGKIIQTPCPWEECNSLRTIHQVFRFMFWKKCGNLSGKSYRNMQILDLFVSLALFAA